MGSTNRAILVGRVGRDPEVEDGEAVVSLATERRDPDEPARPAGEWDRTDWHRLVFPGNLAGLAADHLSQGCRIYVEGSLEYDSYRRDGVTIPTVVVRVRDCVLLRSDR